MQQPGRTPAPPDRWTPPISGSPLSNALSLSLAHCSVGPTCRRRFLHPCASPLSLPRGPGSPVAEPLPRVSPFLPMRRGPSLLVLPSPRPPWTGECAPVHFTGFLGHDAHPRAQLPSLSPASAPHYPPPPASFHAAPTSLALCPCRQQSPETRVHVPGHPARWRPRQTSPSSAPR
jgi:hypothetical protein